MFPLQTYQHASCESQFWVLVTPLPQEPLWKNAVLSGPFETAVVALKPFLPGDMARRIRYR